MSLRTDKVSGITTCVFGIVMVSFASFGLLIVAFQRLLISAMPSMPNSPNGISVVDGMLAIHRIWFVYFPIMIVGGLVYIGTGYYVRRGSLIARRIAQANSICGYVWVIAYSISCYQIMDIVGPPPNVLPELARSVLQWFSIVFSTLISAALPTGLLYILSRPHHHDATVLPRPAKSV